MIKYCDAHITSFSCSSEFLIHTHAITSPSSILINIHEVFNILLVQGWANFYKQPNHLFLISLTQVQ